MVFRSKKSDSKTQQDSKAGHIGRKSGIVVAGVKMHAAQFATFLGVILGSLAASYYLGFFSGHTAGFQSARESVVATLPKIPIFNEDRSADTKNSDTLTSEIYAKLDSEKTLQADKIEAHKEAPVVAPLADLAPIPETSVEQVKVPPSEVKEKVLKAEKHEIELEGSEVPILQAEKEEMHEKKSNTAKIVELGKGNLQDKEKTTPATLGDLLDQKEAEISKNIKKNETQRASAPILDSIDESPKKLEKAERILESEKIDIEKVAKAASSDTAPIVNTFSTRKNTENQEPKKILQSTEPKITKSSAKSGWFAQVAAPKTKDDAVSLVNKLRSSGFQASIETADVRGEKYFRVIVGPENTRETGERLVGQLRRESYIKGAPFVRMIK